MTGTRNSGMFGVIQLQKEIFSERQISKAFPPVVHCRVCLVISMPSSSLTYHFNTIDPSFFLDASSSHIFKAKHSPNFSPITLTTSLQSSLFILPHPPNYQTLNNSSVWTQDLYFVYVHPLADLKHKAEGSQVLISKTDFSSGFQTPYVQLPIRNYYFNI